RHYPQDAYTLPTRAWIDGMTTPSGLPERPTWHRHFFYRKNTLKTTWKLRASVLLLAILVPMVTRGYWTVALAESLMCAETITPSDALLLENFDPDYLVFEKAEALQRQGVASRVFVPALATSPDREPDAFQVGVVELMARISRVKGPEIIPIQD